MKSFLTSLFGSAEPTASTLDQARNLITTVKANAEKFGKMFNAASLDLDAMLAKGDNALADHINTSLTGARAQGKTERDTELLAELGVKPAEGQTAEAALKAALDAKNSESATHTVFVSGCEKAGIKVTAADASKGVTETDVTNAINNRVSLKAAELSAQIGTQPLETKINNDPAAAAKTEKTLKKGTAGLAQLFAAKAQ